MPATASAQPLTVFQSPVMAAVERLLGRLTRRILDPQSQFGSRNLRFVDGILSRRPEHSWFSPSPIRPRQLTASQHWVLPHGWIPTKAELARLESQPSRVLPGRTPRESGGRPGPLEPRSAWRPPFASSETGSPVAAWAAFPVESGVLAAPHSDRQETPGVHSATSETVPFEESRVRDWLPQWDSAQAAPSSQFMPAVAPAASSLSRSLLHLDWADAQLGRTPAQRLAAAAWPLSADASVGAWAQSPAMPLVSPPEFVSSAKKSILSAAAAQSVMTKTERGAQTVGPAASGRAPSPEPAARLAVAAWHGSDEIQALRGDIAAMSGESGAGPAAGTLGIPLDAELGIAPPNPRWAALASMPSSLGSEARPTAAAFASASERVELGGLAAPLSPTLWAVPNQPMQPFAPPAVAPMVRPLPAWSGVGALALHFERFAADREVRASAGAPVASFAFGLRPWAGAPGVPVALSQALSREGRYTPSRWPLAGAALPYLPAPARPDELPTAAATALGRPRVRQAQMAAAPFSGAALPAATPWREAGGAATLAELFAAGIGLGSGALGTLAQSVFESPGNRNGLIPRWLEPSLQLPFIPSLPSRDGQTTGGARLPMWHGEDPAMAAFAPPSPAWASSAARVVRPLPPPARYRPGADSLVFVQKMPNATSLAAKSFGQAGVLGLRTAQWAQMQGVRVAGAGVPSAAEMQKWSGAPGIKEALAQSLGGALPYLREAAPSLRAPNQPDALPASLPFGAAPAFSSVSTEMSPWREPGGAAFLAELFAAGIDLGSASAGWLAEPTSGRQGSLVPEWLGALVRAEQDRRSARSAAGAPRAPLPSLSYVTWIRASEAAQNPGRAEQSVAPGAFTARRGPLASQMPAQTWAPSLPIGKLGGLAVEAEQFAAGYGLGQVELEKESGSLIPLAGGMVFVRREESPRKTAGEQAQSLRKPQLHPAADLLRAGGVGLRTELLAATQAARVSLEGRIPPILDASLLLSLAKAPLVDKESTLASSAPRAGWLGASGLLYLGPDVRKDEPAPKAGERTKERVTGSVRESSLSASLGRSAPLSRMSILDLATADFAGPSSSSQATAWAADKGVAADAAQAAPFGWAGDMPVLSLRAAAPGLGLSANADKKGIKAGHAAADIGARYAAAMLTGFPRESSAGEMPRTLWPHSAVELSERLSRVLSLLPADWQPAFAIPATLVASGTAAVPWWQQLLAAMPQVRSSDAQAFALQDEAAAGPAAARRSALTLLSGGQAQGAQKSEPHPAAAKAAQRAPEAELMMAALKQSGASQAEVNASLRLMHAIRSHASGQPTRTEDRLNLGDLTLIALSMGESKIAASASSAAGASSQGGTDDSGGSAPQAAKSKMHPLEGRIGELTGMVVRQVRLLLQKRKDRAL